MAQLPLNANPPVYTPATAAEYLGMTERQVRDAVRKNRITYVRLGQYLRFRITDLNEYLDANTVRAVLTDD
ncbi:helix-turn-helix domain-containing protein [Pseudarthrobacter sp. MDT3-28]|uniref:helix-turn-helix domain-containing protein n=1 Tax=Pseudarthrobacter raffinosi TaxID=2953651 RepID=UPI00208EE1DA|nr:helix-turn-helix domain-containing protein [Pseudarthrobacter sp. MDT3-28]MCO4239573.1 helix-turn-helix domain-containing protein [Pseudarthrobacter sp. MDT3-28]